MTAIHVPEPPRTILLYSWTGLDGVERHAVGIDPAVPPQPDCRVRRVRLDADSFTHAGRGWYPTDGEGVIQTARELTDDEVREILT